MKKLKNGKWQIRWRDKGGRQRAKNCRNKEQAQQFARTLERGEEDRGGSQRRLADLVADYQRVRYPAMGVGSRVRCDNLTRLYLAPLMGLKLSELTPRRIDEWLEWMKADVNRFGKGTIRKSFSHELDFLKTVLNFFLAYNDDDNFAMPVKSRHSEAARLRNRGVVKNNDLREGDFLRFRDELARTYGPPMAALATLQFYNALRISEAVALRWEDVQFDWASPRLSRISFNQHAIYARSKGVADFLEPGLKNSDEGKEHPMLPQVFEALRAMWKPRLKGLVFPGPGGKEFLTYRQVQHRYNHAFAALDLPYRSTHVMRHGGTSKTYNETDGDKGIAAQQLGNTPGSRAVDVYARRSVLAFTRYAARQWEGGGGGEEEEEVRAPKVHSLSPGQENTKDFKH